MKIQKDADRREKRKCNANYRKTAWTAEAK